MSRIEEKIDAYLNYEDIEKDYENIKMYSEVLALRILSLENVQRVIHDVNFFIDDDDKKQNWSSAKNKKGKRVYRFSVRTFSDKIWKYKENDDDDWPEFIGKRVIDNIIKDIKGVWERQIKTKIKTEVFPEEKSFISFTVKY